jgi:UDP-N-acetylglucosamine 2-epimerase (non-hydrolysing)
MNHIAFVFGTRPEIIKLAPLFRACSAAGQPYSIIHTNQHYSPELDSVFFEELDLPRPHFNLNVGPGSQTAQTARIMTALESVFEESGADCVIVQGDTTSVLAGTLVASKMGIKVAHVEAGLRSYDRSMPEEINRIVTDHVSDFLFPPTEACAATLRTEGIDPAKIHVVGNTVVDSVLQGIALSHSVDLEQFDLEKDGYMLLTLHRPANVDSKEALEETFALLEKTVELTGIPFFFPIHPRTEASIKRHGVRVPYCIKTHAPVGYRAFIALQRNASAIFTDSGGIQEEACILGVPCITLRDTTERPETIDVGANRLVFRDYAKVREALEYFKTAPKWENPFGDGTAAAKIIALLS